MLLLHGSKSFLKERERQRETERDRERQRETEKDRERQKERQTDRQMVKHICDLNTKSLHLSLDIVFPVFCEPPSTTFKQEESIDNIISTIPDGMRLN